jgi:type IV pilus assembly protein PilW
MTHPTRRQQGLSLVELMVALTLGLLLVAGVTRLFLSARQGYRIQESHARQQDNARFVMEILSREIRHADFWGGASPDGLTVLSSLGTATACSEAWMADVAFPLRAYAGDAASPLGGCTVTDYVANSDVLVVRYADPNAFYTNAELNGPPADVTDNGRLLVRASVGASGSIYLIDDLAAARAAQPGDESDGVVNYKYVANVLFVRANNQSQPTLYQRSLDSSGVSNSQQLAEGVEMLRYSFGIDQDGDLAVDRYIGTADMLESDWPRVLTVRVGLLMRGDALDEFSDDRSYTFPDGYTYTPASNARRYQRRLYVQDLQVRNRMTR